MCTAISMVNAGHCYFGRNMDIPFFFHQKPIFIPKGYLYLNRAENKTHCVQRSILGMGALIDSHPAMADAMNESGLACAGLNYAGYAQFGSSIDNSKENITPYDFILWALSKHDSVEQVTESIKDINFVSIPINENTPVSQLHWMLCDRSGKSVVVECDRRGLHVYDNPVGVMTNCPEFPWHLTNLNEHLKLSSNEPDSLEWSGLKLSNLGVGAGSNGLPGGFSSVSRFVRAAFARANPPKDFKAKDEVAQFFHMLDSCSMLKGCVKTAEGLDDFTSYSSCMDLNNCVYYYKNYENSRINAVRLESNGTEFKIFDYITKQDINYMN